MFSLTIKQLSKGIKISSCKRLNFRSNYQFGFFDTFMKKKYEEAKQSDRARYEENLQKSQKAKKQKEGETIIVEDSALEEERKKREAEEVFDPDKFTSKETYIKMLSKDRLKDEEEKEKSKVIVQDIEKRKIREYEVELSQLDYAKIAAQNINIRPVDKFKHPEELFYFIGDLEVRLSEENLKACLIGFLSLAERINEADIESSVFQKFKDIILQNLKTIGNDEILLLFSEFGDLYCIKDAQFWERLEQRISRRLEKWETPQIVQMIEHFSRQKEGTEYFFDKIEMVFQMRLESLTIGELSRLSEAYYNMKRGTKEFFNLVQKKVEQKIGQASVNELLQISRVFKHAPKKDNLFQQLEQGIIKNLKDFDFQTTCNAASGFGFLLGSSEMYGALEVKVRSELAARKYNLQSEHSTDQTMIKVTLEELKYLMDGFLHTYRGSRGLITQLKQELIHYQPQLSTSEAARVVKSLYMIEIDDKEIFQAYEARIIYDLQGVDEISLPDLLEVTKAYTMTRNGSRKLYKLLEIVIKHRWNDIARDAAIMKQLFVYFSKSGLCSESLMTLFEKFELINN